MKYEYLLFFKVEAESVPLPVVAGSNIIRTTSFFPFFATRIETMTDEYGDKPLNTFCKQIHTFNQLLVGTINMC
jgi:hypothetical protein